MSTTRAHTDQAGTLRALQDHLGDPLYLRNDAPPPPRVFAITSGKGGVGKTAVAANVALALAKMQKNVLIIDADLGLANIDVVFGLAPRYNLNHFFKGERRLEEIMVEGPHGIRILPAGSGVQQFTHLDGAQQLRFMEELDSLHGLFDVVLIDTEAGISENVTYFSVAAQDVLMVTTPDPTAITDAYALMKLLSTRFHQKTFSLIVNSVANPEEGLDVFQKLTTVANRYLSISIDYLGCIPFDKRMSESIRRQQPILELYPGSKISSAFEGFAKSLTTMPETVQPKGTIQFFWRQLLSLNPEDLP
jgi:flagellar biosynthesis protein FlhG